MSLVRFDPFRDMFSLQDRVNRLFDPFARITCEDYGSWVPAVDIREDGEAIQLKAELPGLKQEEIDIHLDNNVLTIKGERSRENENGDGRFHRTERFYGSFSRSFSLPTTVDTEKVRAVYKDGLLEVTLPKAESSRSRKIQVSTN